MGKVFRNLVEYSGVDDYPYDNLKNFKQINVDHHFYISAEKPDIENIIKVNVESEIIHKQVVQTPVGISFEGQEATGFNLLLSGDIMLRIEYSAKNTTQSIHTVNTRFTFCDFVVLPKDFNPTTIIFPSTFVEDIYSENLDCRCIYNNISLLLAADIC